MKAQMKPKKTSIDQQFHHLLLKKLMHPSPFLLEREAPTKVRAKLRGSQHRGPSQSGPEPTNFGLSTTLIVVDYKQKAQWLEQFKNGKIEGLAPSPHLCLQLEQNLQDKELPSKSETTADLESSLPKAQVITLQLEGGSHLLLAFLDPKLSSFDLYTCIRKNTARFWDLTPDRCAPQQCIERCTLKLNLDRASSALAQKIVFALAASSQIQTWEEFRFTQSNAGASQTKKNSEAESPHRRLVVTSKLDFKSLQKSFQEGLSLGHANSQVRSLAELPPNFLYPKSYLQIVQTLIQGTGIGLEFLGTQELERLGAGAFLAVGRADPARHQGIAVLKYLPKVKSSKKPSKSQRPTKDAPIVLVGKGLCFDTGGYSLKPTESMLGMHADMTGSALALTQILAAARLELPVEIHAYLALTENLISPSAYRPNEVVQALDGTTIEVVDTDAEGRMALSDTLALVRRSKPALVIDYATLTGAAIRSLDTRRSAVFSHHPELAELAVKVGEASGERVWNFPMSQDYRDQLKSECADLIQCGPGRKRRPYLRCGFSLPFYWERNALASHGFVSSRKQGGIGTRSN
jgi:leucyl aminopeptidase